MTSKSSKSTPFELNAASIIGLKAELYRKREEAKETQKRPKSTDSRPKTRPIWARSREKSNKEQKKLDVSTTSYSNDSDQLAKSRQKLEAKSRLYEELTQSSRPILNEDDENGYLVDFERKTLERNRSDDDETKSVEDEEVSDNEEDWVEYIDAFGRNRRCLREDLPQHMQRNDDLRHDLVKKEDSEDDKEDENENESRKAVHEDNTEPVIPSKLNLHYADVQNEEVRTHGVGFFQFSTDETTRQAQLKELKQIRKVTEDTRQRREMIKEKRKAQMELRLAKVKERRLIASEAKSDAGDSGITEEEDSNEKSIAATLSELRAQVEESREKHRRNNPLFKRREWDRGKAMMTAEKYLEQRRTERKDDFAPPSSYTR